MKISSRFRLISALSLLVLAPTSQLEAQQLEPRRWAHLPADIQFGSLAYLYTDGEIFLNPVLRIEDAQTEQHTINARYIYSFGLAGRSARFEADLPYVRGHWQGLVNDEFQTTERRGIADPRLRLSVLLHGAPSLSGEAFSTYRATHPVNTVVGAAVSLKVPIGQYYPERLINLGENRYVLRSELGVVHTRHRLSYEFTGAASLFSDNDEFFPGNSRREQDPLFLLQGHVVYTVRPGFSWSLSAGYGFSGESRVNDVSSNDRHDNYFWALALDYPLGKRQGLKIAYANTQTNNLVGVDSDNILVAWTYLF